MPRSSTFSANAVDRRNQSCDGKTAQQSLIDELEAAVAGRDIGSRADVLRRVTDLYVTGSGCFDIDQKALFDDVMGRLVDEIEQSSRVAFSERLAQITDVPPKVTRVLALDDSIEVAGPLLSNSDQLDDETLIAGAKTKSQDHLLAISRRRLLNESVTDVLVERGNQQVVVSTAANSGARFSEFGYSTLVTRSENDDELALTIWSRKEIPRVHLLTLFAAASEAVQRKFETMDRGKVTLVRDMIKQASDEIQRQSREHSPEFVAAQQKVQLLHQEGALTEKRLHEYADAGMFDETVVALALLCDLPLGVVERSLVHERSDQLLVLAKSIGLSWEATKAVLIMQSSTERPTREIEQIHSNFKKLKPETALTAIHFYRLRERAVKGVPH